jgi:hypothetical protein
MMNNDVLNYEGHGGGGVVGWRGGGGCLKAVLTSNTNNLIIYPVPWHNFTLTQTGSPRRGQTVDQSSGLLYSME